MANAVNALANVNEHLGDLSTGDWRNVGATTAPAVSVRIVGAWADIALEWPDVQVMTGGSTVIVTVTASTIPLTLAAGAAQRRFSEFADIPRLHALDDLCIEQVLTGGATSIVLRDDLTTPFRQD